MLTAKQIRFRNGYQSWVNGFGLDEVHGVDERAGWKEAAAENERGGARPTLHDAADVAQDYVGEGRMARNAASARSPSKRENMQRNSRHGVAVQVPEVDDNRVLRNVMLGSTGYRLLTWDTGRRFDTGQWKIGYAFYEPGHDEPLFAGEDLGIPPSESIDSDEALRSAIGWFTLRPGDTDDEFFEDYTPRQLAWAERHAEYLAEWGMEESYFFDEGADPPPLIDVDSDDWVREEREKELAGRRAKRKAYRGR